MTTKPAWLWVHPLQPYNVGYPGGVAGATAVSYASESNGATILTRPVAGPRGRCQSAR